MSAERDALGALSEIMQSCEQTRVLFLNNAHHNNPVSSVPVSDITEVGRTARVYSELALRTEPTLSDVQLALIDAGRYLVVIIYD